MKSLIVALVLAIGLTSCAKTPPNLTPQATVAFKATQVVKALDLLRDTAITANEQKPPVLTEDQTRKVVQYHQMALKVIQVSPVGWQQTVLVGLDELSVQLGAGRPTLVPYMQLIKTVLIEVTR
jgi:hypothetical protein